MNVHGKPTRTIWPLEDGVEIIDQTALPHTFVTRRLSSVQEAARAIATMQVRGAPLIGATAAYGALTRRTEASRRRTQHCSPRAPRR
jgi:methylthioribose-1-phosphate isomerase